MAEKKLSLSEVGKLLGAVIIGLVGGGIGTKAVSPTEQNLYAIPEKSAITIEKISERQLDYGQRIVKLETTMQFVAEQTRKNSEQITKNAERNDAILEQVKSIENKLPYTVTWR